MADNTQLNENSTPGDIIATDDIGGVKHQRVKVQYGPDGSATDVTATTPLPVTVTNNDTSPIEIVIVDEAVPTTSQPVDGYGEVIDISIVVTGWDLWRGSELTPTPTEFEAIPLPPDAGEQMQVVSESGQDTSAGTGVRSIRIEYLDAAGNALSEDITMNGQTPVTTVATNIRFINKMYALTTGSNLAPVGHIKIHQSGDNQLVYNMIAAGDNTSVSSQYMVPLGKTLVLKNWHASEFNNDQGTFRIRSTDFGGVRIPRVFNTKGSVALKNSVSGSLVLNTRIPELSILKVTAYADQVNVSGSCSWYGELVDNP